MLDVHIGLEELKRVFEIHVIAVNNEVKEVLWLCQLGIQTSVSVKTINLKNNTHETFSFDLETVSSTQYSNPLQYLYEPNAAILKSGGFTHISQRLNMLKLHQHSHLFTSETLQEFPGRAFKIDAVFPYSKKKMKQNIAGLQANVATRNFTITVAGLRKKWNIKDGGNVYLFFTTLLDASRVVIKCSKVNY